jgi:hypothetical protein
VLHPFRLVRRLVALVVLAAAAYYVVTAFQVVTASRAVGAANVGRRSAAIIVVGPGADGASAGVLTPDLRLRLRHAARLMAAHRAPVVILCDESAGAVATDKAYLVSRGVAAGRIETAVAAELPGEMHVAAGRLPAHRAIVVADSWQTLWVTHVADSVGLTVVVSPVTPSDHSAAAEAGAVVVQAAAVAWGRIAGFAQTGFVAG